MLGKKEIIRRLSDHRSGLAITPIIDAEEQIGEGSVDLRLGPDFIITSRETGISIFDPGRADEIAEGIRGYQRYLRRPPGSAFYLHPGEFVIARTLEYITLPEGTAAQVTSRSSWGRLGLVIATAPLIQPSFTGTITLELSNLGTVPMVLYVGLRIAQVSLYDLNPQAAAKGR
jgi:dCTP deaminase